MAGSSKRPRRNSLSIFKKILEYGFGKPIHSPDSENCHLKNSCIQSDI